MKRRHTILVLAALTLAGRVLRADQIDYFGVDARTPGGSLPEVTIQSVDGQSLVYRTPAGEERRWEVKRIFKITVAGDAALTAAEDAYVDKQWDKAIDGYQKVVRGGGEAWKTVYAVPRLLDAANKTKRFDAALAGYIGLAHVDAEAAAAIRPALPEKGSKFLDDAAHDLDTAARAATKDPERQALLSFLLDVDLARGDQPAAEATVDQLLKLAGPNANDPKLAGMVANIRLGQARVAFEAKRWTDVATAVAAAAPRLIDPKQQAEALYLRASSKLALAKPDDRDAKLDAGLDFMRVAANFRNAEDEPYVAQSLLGAAGALESIGDAAEARSLYNQVNTEFANTPFATQAADRIAKLPAKSP